MPACSDSGKYSQYSHPPSLLTFSLTTQHSTRAAQERERGRWHQGFFRLRRAVQALDCALDPWQQVPSWLDLAGNGHRQQDPESLETIRALMAQVQWHQGRRRALHQQVLSEDIEARQRKQQQWDQQGSQHVTGPLSEAREERVYRWPLSATRSR